MATLYKTNGKVKRIFPNDENKFFDLKELHKLVNGYIEPIQLPDGRVLMVNENGKNLFMPPNKRATHVCAESGIDLKIVGDAVLLDADERDTFVEAE